MNTQISFTTDQQLKAKEIGLPIKSVLIFDSLSNIRLSTLNLHNSYFMFKL